MKSAADVKVGNLLIIDGVIYKVEAVEAKGAAKVHKTINIKMRSIPEGKFMENAYPRDEKLEEADVVKNKALYSYTDGNNFVFIDESSYENYEIPKEMIGEKEVFLKENDPYTVIIYNGSPIDVVFPPRIRLKVTTSPPGIKQHDSTTAKKVTLENGMEVDAPQFIEEGDVIEVDSETGKYIDRLKQD